MYVCLNVCVHFSIYHLERLKTTVRIYEIFYACYLWPWRGRPLTTVQCVCTSGFVDDVMFSHNGTNGAKSKRRVLRVRQVAATGQSFCLQLQAC